MHACAPSFAPATLHSLVDWAAIRTAVRPLLTAVWGQVSGHPLDNFRSVSWPGVKRTAAAKWADWSPCCAARNRRFCRYDDRVALAGSCWWLGERRQYFQLYRLFTPISATITRIVAQLGIIAIGAFMLMVAGELDLSIGLMIGFARAWR